MTSLLVKLDESYREFVQQDGSMVVELDKALYGCVEAAKLWYDDLVSELKRQGFVPNEYDECVFNKTGRDGIQVTIALHVDDLMITSQSEAHVDAVLAELRKKYNELTVHEGKRLDYLGMTFNFSRKEEVSITMPNCVDGIISECGVTSTKPTLAASTLFDIREDAEKLGW